MNIKKQITVCKTDTEIYIYPESKKLIWIMDCTSSMFCSLCK